jgi:tripartite-type tricarboxylate transporter receptor subunit TctC
MSRFLSSSRSIALTALLAGLPVQAFAQADYPNRTIRIVVPLPPPGGPDMLARILSDKLAAAWGKPVVVENRPGGGLNVGAQSVATADPDGYTLLVTPPGPLVTHQHLFAKLGFDPAAFTPVSILVKFPFVLAVRSNLPVMNLQELVAYGRANPDKLNFGSSGRGGPPHLMAEMFKAKAGVRLVHVPYAGLMQAQTDLLGGQIDMMFHDLGNTLPHVRDGKVRVLGVTSEARIAELSDVPAISELYPGFLATSWIAMAAPPRTPPAIAMKLSKTIAKVLRAPDIVRKLAGFSMAPVAGTPRETAAFLDEETQRWREVIVTAGITPQ